MGLVSSKSNFFINKISQGRKSVREKSTFLRIFALYTFYFFRNSVVVFDEAHNIDNTCIDSMSVKINRKLLDKCQNSITVLEEEIQRLKSEDSSRLREEYDKLVAGNILFKY